MKKFVRRLAVVGVACFLASCASSAKLARQSNEALAKGDLHRAYDRAERAIEKDPQNQAARAAYDAASDRVAADFRSRVMAAAAADTVAAANLALEYRQFLGEVARHGTSLAPAPDYARAERAIMSGAAGLYYQRGIDAMAAHRPKVAVDEFTATRRYADPFADVASRLAAARREATARVALLPFVDRTGVAGLSQETADAVQREISNRAASEFRFTQIVSASEIEHNMTVAELRSMRPEDAAEVGRRIGADWIVIGRFRGLRGSDSHRTAKFALFHRVDHKDSTGVTVSRWDEFALPISTRQREVSVQFEFDIVEVATGAVLAHREQAAQAAARVAWTDFRGEEHDDRYALLPPDIRRADPKRAKAVDQQWKDEMGSWELRDFLRSSREQRGRDRYSSRYRGEFYSDTRDRPVWMGELPSESEMAFVALHEVWRPVLAAIKDLDQKN